MRQRSELACLGAGALRQLHWHLNLDEWQYLHNGSMEVCPSRALQML